MLWFGFMYFASYLSTEKNIKSCVFSNLEQLKYKTKKTTQIIIVSKLPLA